MSGRENELQISMYDAVLLLGNKIEHVFSTLNEIECPHCASENRKMTNTSVWMNDRDNLIFRGFCDNCGQNMQLIEVLKDDRNLFWLYDRIRYTRSQIFPLSMGMSAMAPKQKSESVAAPQKPEKRIWEVYPQYTQKTLDEAVDNLEMGMRCFINNKTGQVVGLPDFEQHWGEVNPEDWQDLIDVVGKDKENFVEIFKPQSRDAYMHMETFVEKVTDEDVRRILDHSIHGPKPFSRFKHAIYEMGPWRDEWFSHKKEQMFLYVENLLFEVQDEMDEDQDETE